MEIYLLKDIVWTLWKHRVNQTALVADPNLNKNVGVKIMGKLSKFIHDLVIDFDLSSLYPSIIRCFNIASSSQYGRLIIDTKSKHNYGKTEGRDLGGEVLDDLSSKDYNNFCIKHHGLSTTDKLIERVNKKFYNGDKRAV